MCKNKLVLTIMTVGIVILLAILGVILYFESFLNNTNNIQCVSFRFEEEYIYDCHLSIEDSSLQIRTFTNLPIDTIDNRPTLFKRETISYDDCIKLYKMLLSMKTNLDLSFENSALPYISDGIYIDGRWFFGIKKENIHELKEVCMSLIK